MLGWGHPFYRMGVVIQEHCCPNRLALYCSPARSAGGARDGGQRCIAPSTTPTNTTEEMTNMPTHAADDLTVADRPDEHGDGLDAVLNIRLTRREKAALQETARLAGLTLSGLARRRCLGRKVAIAPNPVLAEAVRRASEQVRRLDVESRGVYHEHAAAILQALREALNRLGAG